MEGEIERVSDRICANSIIVTESGKALPHKLSGLTLFNMDMLYIVRLVRLSTYFSILSDGVPIFYSRTAAAEGHSSLLRQSAVFAMSIVAKQYSLPPLCNIQSVMLLLLSLQISSFFFTFTHRLCNSLLCTDNSIVKKHVTC